MESIKSMKCIFYGDINGQYRAILPVSNTLSVKVNFHVLTTHPRYYSIAPESGSLEPNDSCKVQFVLTEFCSDYERHQVTVEFFVPDPNRKEQLGTLHSRCNLMVDLCSKSKNSAGNNTETLTNDNPLNRPLLDLEIRRAIQTGDYFLDTENALFPNLLVVPKAVRFYFTKYYSECLVETLKNNLKSIVASIIKDGNTDQIQEFRDRRDALTLQSPFLKDLLQKKQTVQLSNMLYLSMKSNSTVDKTSQPIITNVKKYFDMCMTLFYDEVAETTMRQLLVTWFKSGHMTEGVFHSLQALKDLQISPSALKSINWQDLASHDHYSKGFERVLKNIIADQFLQKEELYSILNIFAFEKTKLAVSQDSHRANVLVITGRIIFLSDIINQVEQKLREDTNINEVRFYVKNVFNIDSDLENETWHGKNVVIVADKVHVWAAHAIDVSGIGYNAQDAKKRARDGRAYGENGADGKDGRAGESSGNIVFLTEELIEGDLLTLKLNGGNGEYGEDGGNGADGKDGCGVSRSDLDSLILEYSSLYWGRCDPFFEFTPDDTTELYRKVDRYNKYVYAKFQDDNGRIMYWSYAEDYSLWSTSTYDLYFLIKGSEGTAGGIGGQNGVGGEGGNRGECTARMLYSGKELRIKNIQKNPGRSGEHGCLGKPGRFGKNGNDMALVDRSTISCGKKYIGSGGNMSIAFNFRMNNNDSRFDGYEKWVKERSSYYVHFALSEVPAGSIMKMESQLKTNADRKAQSMTTSKASIIVNNVVSEFAECFQQDDAIITEACRAQEQADREENDEDTEKNEETVAEEVNVLLDCAEQNNNMPKLYGSKKSRSHLIQRLKSYEAQTTGTSIELALELFQHELSTQELEQANTKLKQLVRDVKLVAEGREGKASQFSVAQIRTLANNIDHRLEQKIAQARLRAQKELFFDKYVNTTANVDRTLDTSTPTLIGVKPVSEYICRRVQFFNQYHKLGVAPKLLEAMFEAFHYLSQNHGSILAVFDAGRTFDWTDENAMKAELEKHKVISASHKNKSKAEETRLDLFERTLKEDMQNLESVFENFNELIKADKSKVLLKKFGLMPTSKIVKEEQEEQQRQSKASTTTGKVEEKSTSWFSNWRDHLPSFFNSKNAVACFVIKFYFQTRSVLTFSRTLYFCNVLANAQILHPGTGNPNLNSAVDVDSPDFTDFMNEQKSKPLDVESGRCEEFVQLNNVNAAACRFLFAYENDVNIRVYREVRYALAELQESFNSKASEKLLLLSHNGKMYSIQPGINYRSLTSARQRWTAESAIPLPEPIDLEKIHSIVSYFPKEYMTTVSSWIHVFQVTNQSHASTLLSLLKQRFDIDGCQLSIVELQAILVAYSHAALLCRTNEEFLLKLAALCSQHQILDVFLYARIENALKRRIGKSRGNEVIKAIHLIDSPHLKALLATKLNDGKFSEEALVKLLIMLRYAVDRFQRLEKMTLDEWIDTSQRQKWSAIGELLKDYGAAGYYLAFLDSRNRPEEPMLRNCLDEVATTSRVLIPEKVIARIAYLIAYGEVNANQEYFHRLKQLFEVISENYSHYLPPEQQNDGGMQLSGYPLLMNERNQNDLLAQVKRHHNDSYEPIFPTGERTTEKLRSLIVGQHDDENRKADRQIEINRLAEQLVSQQCANALIINEVDDVIERVFSKPNGPRIRLRDTQKMAVLIAAESAKNTLLQVNTGEGKTMLIAALAIVRARQNKTVDVITSSPVLAARDVEKMRPIFSAFRITASHNCEEQIDARKLAYKNQIVYGDMQHFQRDYLLHNFYKKNILGDRQRQCVIVDEVDNMLLDNGNNMLYLSHNIAGLEMLMSLFVFLHRVVNVPLNGEDQYKQFDSKVIKKQVLSNLFGCISKEDLEKVAPNMRISINRVWQKLIEMKVIDHDGLLQIQSESELPRNFLSSLKSTVNESLAIQVKDLICVLFHRERLIQVPRYLHFFVLRHLDGFIENAKRAMFMQDRDEYVIDVDHKNSTSDLNPRVTIIDKNTGVDLVTSQWSEGLHQAIQLKHSCRLSPISLKAIFVSNVGYFKGYERINGLSGTLGSVEESKSLVALYKADLVRVPTWKPKNFYEHVPLVAAHEGVWLQNIYAEVKDQIVARRSVLIICNSISQVDTVHHGLERLYRLEKNNILGKSRFAQIVRKHLLKGDSWKKAFINKLMTDCFENLIVYRRDHDEFDLSGSKALVNGRAIIATNLAGRGTDIELSEGLQQAGGLHVIVAFLPINCRIEEQAFGRAARCGHPGSGQIIALIEDDQRIDSSETPTIFQLKEFRDNAEVHRLQSLKRRYEYRTAVEESCLSKFWEHSSKALEHVKITENTPDSSVLPTPMQIVYFALLDEWALWLDEKTPLIEQCERDCNDEDKRAIIQSVEEFLASHPLDSVQSAMKWIRAPQPLLTIGLIALNNQETDRARSIFDRIAVEFPEFRAEAFYYISVMQQRITRRVYSDFQFGKAHLLDTWKKSIFGEEQRDLIATFNAFHESRRHFSMRRLHRGELVTTVSQMQQANQSLISTNGFADQHQEYVANHDAIVGNIDKFLGKPIEPDDLRIEGQDHVRAFARRNMLKEFGLLTRTTLTPTLHTDQIEFICSRHPISRQELKTKLETLHNKDSSTFENDDRPEVETFELRNMFKLPNRFDFWNELKELGVFVEESKFFTTKSSRAFKGLTPIDSKIFDSSEPLLLQLTDVPRNSVKFYKLSDVISSEATSNQLQLQVLLESEEIATELMAVINPTRLFELDVYMRDFEGFKLEELQEHLGIDNVTAKWIVYLYVQDKIIEPDIDQVYRLVGKQYAHDLLPDGLCSAVEKFFADRFAYSHALDALRESFASALRKPGTPKSIYLPCNPYEDLLHDMIECGIVIPSRVSRRIPRKIDNDYDEAVNDIDDIDDSDKIKDILEANRATMTDADCKLVATQKYVINNGPDPNDELKHFVTNGLKQVAIVEEDTTWVWLWGIAAVLSIVVAVVAIVALGWTGIGIAVALAALALAARAIYKVGSYAYYRVMRTSAKRTVTVDSQSNFEFTVLREFNAAAIEEATNRKQTNVLLNKVHYGITDLSNKLSRSLIASVESSINFDEYLPEEMQGTLDESMNEIQAKPAPYQLVNKALSTAVEQSIATEFVKDEIRLITQHYLAQVEPSLYDTLKSMLSQKPIHRNPEKLDTVFNDVKSRLVEMKSEVLQKIVKAACKALPENFKEQMMQIKDELVGALSTASQESSPSESEEESSDSNDDDETIGSDLPARVKRKQRIEKCLRDVWLESFVDRCSKNISSEVSQSFREPLLRRFENYVKSSTTNDIRESMVSKKARESDINAKRQHHTREKVIQAKTQVEFLENEMERICAECWDVRHEPAVLKCMIINRYPLPIGSAPTVDKAIQTLFNKAQQKLGTVNLLLVNKEQQIQYGQKTKQPNNALQLMLSLHDDHFYGARSNSSKAQEIGSSSCVYESLCEKSEQFACLFHSADEFLEELSDCLVH